MFRQNSKPMQVRQGDILLDPVELPEIPAGAVKKEPEQSNGKTRYVLARGETTDHNHVLERTEGIELYDLPDDYLTKHGLLKGTMLLKTSNDTALVHDVPNGQRADHTPDPVAAGTYYVVPQREYTAEAPRRVFD